MVNTNIEENSLFLNFIDIVHKYRYWLIKFENLNILSRKQCKCWIVEIKRIRFKLWFIIIKDIGHVVHNNMVINNIFMILLIIRATSIEHEVYTNYFPSHLGIFFSQ